MLGDGAYILAEVARLTEIHPARVRSWFKHRPDGAGSGPIFDSDYAPVEGDYAVSFRDLIDVLVAGQFRDRYRVPMRTVRRAYTLLKEELNTEHPFCHCDLYTDGKSIFQYAADRVGDERLTEVVSHQQFFLHIKEKLDHIEYCEITKLARRWKIAEGVVLDPKVGMGKPTIVNTGLTTFVVANQYYANSKDSALVADLYGVSERDVASAVDFEERYGCRHAA